MIGTQNEKKTVCVIGAGAAGMTCGHLLKNKKFNLIILEASETFGERNRIRRRRNSREQIYLL